MADEALLLNQLLDGGLALLHLRKPKWPKQEYEALLKAIAPHHKRKVVLHQYHDLAAKYHVGGVHLRESARQSFSSQQLREFIKEVKRKNLTISTSVHAVKDAVAIGPLFDYVLASPLFDSISKQGYTANAQWTSAPIAAMQGQLIALGGIDGTNVGKALDLGFAGIAILGAVWQSDDPIWTFSEIHRIVANF